MEQEDDSVYPPPPFRSGFGDLALAVLVVTGYGTPLLAALGAAIAGALRLDVIALLLFVLGIAAWIGLIVRTRRAIRERGRRPFMIAAEVLVLVLLPAWGMAYSHTGKDECTIMACDASSTVFRPLAEPEVYGLLALHALTAIAYAVSRRRPGALHPPAELLVHAAMLAGVALHAIAALHFGTWLLAGVVLPPVFLPCLAPALTVAFSGIELRARLLRRGAEARARALAREPDSIYREGPPQVPLPPPPAIHRPTLVWSAGLATALIGLHAVAHAVWLGNAAGALQVFTRTCGYTLSRVPIVELPGDCHYLCTVAARGHAWLVRPLRLGRRGGRPIVVNRQLAVANAFEDLLHERWPRFGSTARRTYDRLGLPVSRWIRAAWMSDAVYVIMKPLEWGFYLALILIDRGAPEERIDRMYR